MIIYAPSFRKKLRVQIAFALFIHSFIHSSVSLSHFLAGLITDEVYARVLKFHTWVPDEKLADSYFFFCS